MRDNTDILAHIRDKGVTVVIVASQNGETSHKAFLISCSSDNLTVLECIAHLWDKQEFKTG